MDNDRIKQLQEQATVDILGVKQVDQKVFAQLIVQDCVEIIESWAEDDFAINGIAVEILEHFDMEIPIYEDQDWDPAEELQKLVDEYDIDDLKNQSNSQVVWGSVLDNIYKCTVTRIDDYNGLLKVVNTETDSVLLEQKVMLSYRAAFGPDAGDVAEWQDLSVQAVDNQ